MKLLKYFLFLLLGFIIFIGLLECLYRYQVIDFYATEYNHFNDSLPTSFDKSILIFGDSFSAQQDGYSSLLKKGLKKYRVINTAIPGTSVKEANLIFDKRVDQTNPSIIVLQVYPANDLTDISKPINMDSLSFLRNSYWKLSSYLYVLPYLNYKLAQFFGEDSTVKQTERNENDQMSVKNYNSRVKTYLKANNKLFSEIIHLNDENGKKMFYAYKKELIKFLRSAKFADKVYLLHIPHASQTSDFYYNQYLQLGADLPNKKTHLNANTAILTQLQSIAESFENVTLVDPTLLFQSVQQDGQFLYYFNDPHLNKNGSRLVSEFLGFHMMKDGSISY